MTQPGTLTCRPSDRMGRPTAAALQIINFRGILGSRDRRRNKFRGRSRVLSRRRKAVDDLRRNNFWPPGGRREPAGSRPGSGSYRAKIGSTFPGVARGYCWKKNGPPSQGAACAHGRGGGISILGRSGDHLQKKVKATRAAAMDNWAGCQSIPSTATGCFVQNP